MFFSPVNGGGVGGGGGGPPPPPFSFFPFSLCARLPVCFFLFFPCFFFFFFFFFVPVKYLAETYGMQADHHASLDVRALA